MDLAVEDVTTAPTTVAAGREITVSWTVHNLAATDATADFWLDAVYISPTPTLNVESRLLAVVPRSGGLEAGTTYIVNQGLAIQG